MVARILDAPRVLRLKDGSRVSYRVIGSGTPVVAVPGGPGMSASYLVSFARGLSEDLCWYLIDPPGTGETSQVGDDSLDALASFYASAAAELGLTSYLIFGHSHGAAVAATMAFRRPHRAAGCILVAPPVVGRRADELAGGFVQSAAGKALARHQEQPWYDEAIRAEFASDLECGGGARRRGLPLYFSHPTVELIVTAWTVLATPNMNENALVRFYELEWDQFDLRPLLPHIGCPLLAIAGEHDWAAPPPQAQFVADLSPSAEVVVMPDCGHFPQIEAPAMFQRIVADWLAANSL
ncbi:MAG TPA: alpha/beta hydrolase [Acidimicrobiia bacterium]|nr:alpha/beta hydrolase [Acidimicrobiia bacterium]